VAAGHDNHKSTIQRIAENVTHLGHPMSPVRVRVCDSPPEPTLIPNPNGHIIMRLPGVGRLKHLEEIHKLRLKNESIRASLGREIYYGFPERTQSRHTSVFSNVYTFKIKIEGILPAQSTINLTSVVRRSILDLYPEPIPEIISGHDHLGNPLRRPHLAVTPLLDVGHQYADGHILGFAVWIPGNIPLELIETLQRIFAGFNFITLGRFGIGVVEYVTSDSEIRVAKALKPDTYTKAEATWASVTPVIFGKYPKRSQVGPGKNGGKVFAELCEMIGLPSQGSSHGPIERFSWRAYGLRVCITEKAR